MSDNKQPNRRKLRSEEWFNDRDHPDHSSIYMERYLNFGLTREELQSGKPIIGIAQTGNDLSPCNRHHLDLAQRVKDGIRDAGGIPLEFPVHPIFEQGKRPTAALDRNLATLSLVEVLYGYPIDGVVLTTGCDKTTPATLMAALMLDLPAIVYSGGPMLNGWRTDSQTEHERRIGSGSTIWENRERYARGELDFNQFMESAASSVPSVGHCNTMGTALTMNCLAEVLGMSLPGCAAIPAPYKERSQMGYFTGLRIVDLVWEDLKPSNILSRESFENAIVACSAMGGSSNAPVHILALAKAAGIELSIDDFQTHGEAVPLLVNCIPAGEYLGEEFYRAGGVPSLVNELLNADKLHPQTLTVTGKTLGENCAAKDILHHEVIKSYHQPLKPAAGFAVLKGNLFDSGLLKKSVISEDFRQQYLSNPDNPNCFSARAIVFEGPEDYHKRINQPELNIDEHCILVIRNCGPVGYPGSAEVVNMLPPDYLVKRGITTLPTMGDGRQSGTSACPSILNISPEAVTGGGLALLKTGDIIEVNLNDHSVNVQISDQELEDRRTNWQPPKLINQTPWQEIYRERVGRLDTGAMLETETEFVRIIDTHGTPRHSH